MRDGRLHGFRLVGMEPTSDPAWDLAGLAGRMGFYREQARLGLLAKRAELAAGLDALGRPLAPIAPKTRLSRERNISPYTGKKPYSPYGRARPKNPPLQASGKDSRTQSLLAAEVSGSGVFFYWGYDFATGLQWGEILARHARGFFVRFRDGFAWVPPRDVLGLSPKGTAWVAERVATWWAAHRKRLAGPALEGFIAGHRVRVGPPTSERKRPASVPHGPPRPDAPLTRYKPTTRPTAKRIENKGTVINMGVGSADVFGRPLRGRQKVYDYE